MEDPQTFPVWEQTLIASLRKMMILFSMALALLMVVTVIMRYGIDNPFLAIEEASVLLGLWLYFTGAAYVTAKRSHICGGALHLLVKTDQGLRWVKLMTSLICLGITLVILTYAAKYGWFTFDKGRKSTYLQWPKWIWVFSMVFGFASMVLFLIMQTLRDYRAVRTRGQML